VSEPFVWRGLDHAALHEVVVNRGLGPAVSMDVEEQWRRIGLTVTRIEGDLTAALAASESEWSGVAADAARTGLTPLGRWALDAAGDAASTAAAVTDQALASAVLRSQLRDNPPVPTETITETLDRNASYGTRGASADEVAIQQAAQAERDGAAAKAVSDARVYENIGYESRRTMDFWTVPPTVTVEAAPAGASGTGSGGPYLTGGPTTDLAATAPGPTSVPLPATAPDGSSATTALGGGGTGSVPAGSAGVGNLPAGSPGAGSVPGRPGAGATGPVPLGPGPARRPAGSGPSPLGPAGRINDALDGPAPTASTPRPAAPAEGGSGRYLPVNPAAPPLDRTAPAPGARGTGPGPWSRAAADAAAVGRGGPFRPVVPAVPRPAPLPDWRSVVAPPNEPGRTGPSVPSEPGRAAQQAVGAPGTGTRSSPVASHGMYPPMTGAGGSGGNERRRPSYLIDDSDVFVDHRWVQPAVITPEDLIPDEQGRLPGQ
jgi:hypothetical protein